MVGIKQPSKLRLHEQVTDSDVAGLLCVLGVDADLNLISAGIRYLSWRRYLFRMSMRMSMSMGMSMSMNDARYVRYAMYFSAERMSTHLASQACM